MVTRESGEVERIPVKRCMNDADPRSTFLHGGEEIRVPEAGKIFVVGNVHKPGAFPVRDGGDKLRAQTGGPSRGPGALTPAGAYMRPMLP